MYITVQFKDRNKVFKGKTYDYKLHEKEKVPEKGTIVRMLDDNYNYLCYGTRVKVVDVKADSAKADKSFSIRLIETTLDD